MLFLGNQCNDSINYEGGQFKGTVLHHTGEIKVHEPDITDP